VKLEGINAFRAKLEAGMTREWRTVHGKRMLVKVYPDAHGFVLSPKVTNSRDMFGRRRQ
jgi:hypothetical protein